MRLLICFNGLKHLVMLFDDQQEKLNLQQLCLRQIFVSRKNGKFLNSRHNRHLDHLSRQYVVP
jgi:hypothetical protein